MPKFIVECKETRTHTVEVEAADEEEAWEIVETEFPEGSVADQFDSLERHAIYRASAVEQPIPILPGQKSGAPLGVDDDVFEQLRDG